MTDLIDLVHSVINTGDGTLYISGKVNASAFIGNDTIRVLENQKSDANDNEKLKNNFENDRG